MRRQIFRRTTLLSLLGLKPAAAQASYSWTVYTSFDSSSTTALFESSSAAQASASSSTETLVATPATSSQVSSLTSGKGPTTPISPVGDVTFTVSLPRPDGEPITMSALDGNATTTNISASTSSPNGVMGGTSIAATTTAAGSSSQKVESRTAATSRRTTGAASPSSASPGPQASSDAAPMSYLKMGMIGALGAAAGLVMI